MPTHTKSALLLIILAAILAVAVALFASGAVAASATPADPQPSLQDDDPAPGEAEGEDEDEGEEEDDDEEGDDGDGDGEDEDGEDGDGDEDEDGEDDDEEEVEINDDENPLVRVETTHGDFVVELYEDDVPNGVASFLLLCQDGFYDGIRFHRIMETFMIQAGCPHSKDEDLRARWGTGGPGYQFGHEASEHRYADHPYTIGYANSGRNDNGSQFFITTNNTGRSVLGLDRGGPYTIFGRVVDGSETIDNIADTPVRAQPSGERSAPTEDVIIEATVITRMRSTAYEVDTGDDDDED